MGEPFKSTKSTFKSTLVPVFDHNDPVVVVVVMMPTAATAVLDDDCSGVCRCAALSSSAQTLKDCNAFGFHAVHDVMDRPLILDPANDLSRHIAHIVGRIGQL